MRLITEINEEVRYIAEEGSEGKKNLFIEGPFLQGNITNRNGRRYNTEILDKEVKRYHAEQIDKNRAYGELGHPAGPTINLERVCMMIKSLRREGDNFIGKAKIMDTPYGNIVRNLMSEGARLGVSSRGMGSLKEVNGVNEVQDDFFLATAADIVADPSAPDAFVNGIMEGVEWVWNNGVLKQKTVEAYKKEIKAAPMKDLKEAKIRVFSHFLSKL
ncbi:prohead core scaffolding protein and protease [uncultured Caudovirales phage]|uniref:Prohead core scaffolding protein and protease n=1 Tax=uncultured Caudovirales phage TaxID=2100421 RepID=A0A6J7WT36_9CAUD|nr:prohead core scaffolding protein and protease [uncultured Caudovirales phage]